MSYLSPPHPDAASTRRAAGGPPAGAAAASGRLCARGVPPRPAEDYALAAYTYTLAPEQIADAPCEPRDACRLMGLGRADGRISHHRFLDLAARLEPGDLLVVNRTAVMPARLHLWAGGRQVEVLACRPLDPTEGVLTACRWRTLARPARALVAGQQLRAGPDTTAPPIAEVIGRAGSEVIIAAAAPLWQAMRALGEVPLPPYIPRPDGPRPRDAADYQTLFAREPGATAASTAALHFTPRVMAQLAARGVEVAELLLHVGPGTFLPVRREHHADVRGHVMHAEAYAISAETRAAVASARARGGRVVAVGTTCLRALETWGRSGAAAGDTDLFVVPGFDFRVVDGLITNFHQPASTLMLLVAALAGRRPLLIAYQAAQQAGYRFTSFGDAMLVL